MVHSSVELIVGALVVLGLILVAARFLLRGESGEFVLPRIVDDSIGMWVVRRMMGRSAGGASPAGTVAATRRAEPRLFDATTAARLGLRRASDVAPPRVAAGAWVRPNVVGEGSGRSGPGPLAIGLLALVAIVIGVLLGAGAAMIGPQGATLGIAGQPPSGSAPQASASTAP